MTFSAGLFPLIFGLIRGNPEGWGSPLIVACLAAAVVLGVLFVLVERRSDHPMLDLSLFAKPAFDGASVAAFVLSASMFSMFLYLTLYIQNILGYTPLESGPALPARHAALVLRRADLGQVRRARRDPLVPGRRARAAWASGCC